MKTMVLTFQQLRRNDFGDHPRLFVQEQFRTKRADYHIHICEISFASLSHLVVLQYKMRIEAIHQGLSGIIQASVHWGHLFSFTLMCVSCLYCLPIHTHTPLVYYTGFWGLVLMFCTISAFTLSEPSSQPCVTTF